MLKAIPNLKMLLDLAKTSMDWLKYEHRHSLRVDCLNHTGIHVTSIYATNKLQRLSSRLQEKKKYKANDVLNVRVYSHSPFPRHVPEAVYKSRDDEITLE